MTAPIIANYPWLTSEFFTRILRREMKQPKLKVVHVDLEVALAPGENYGSQIIRAKLRYETGIKGNTEKEHLSLIVKAKSPEVNADAPHVFADLKLFEKEITIYQNILPKVHALYRSIGDKTTIAPRYVVSCCMIPLLLY